MKKLGVDELFLLSEIADKMEFEFPEFPSLVGKDKKEIDQIQRNYGMKLIPMMVKKIHKAKSEIIQLIETLSEQSTKEMTLKEIIDMFVKIMAQDGVLDFFK